MVTTPYSVLFPYWNSAARWAGDQFNCVCYTAGTQCVIAPVIDLHCYKVGARGLRPLINIEYADIAWVELISKINYQSVVSVSTVTTFGARKKLHLSVDVR